MSGIYINYSKTNNILDSTLEILEASDLKSLVKKGMKVSLKPNMVIDKPPSLGATTHNEIVEGIIVYLKDLGIDNIEIIESSWVGCNTNRVYKICGYDSLSKKYDVPLYDLKNDAITKIKSGDYTFEVCRKAVETDFLINIPVLKAHCQTRFTCNLKNIKGCISDSDKRLFHTLGLHKPIAYLNSVVKTHYCVVDGICGDLTFEEGGTPVTRNMIICGANPVLVDSYCCEMIGYYADDIAYLSLAQKLGIGKFYDSNTQITELNKENKLKFKKADRSSVERLAAYISEDMACSACYSSLIYALHKVGTRPKEKINIGQGFKSKSGRFGCGNCTSGCDEYVKGCPPKPTEIVKFLREI
jgi:uncharacterized protein (DUF362 family)